MKKRKIFSAKIKRIKIIFKKNIVIEKKNKRYEIKIGLNNFHVFFKKESIFIYSIKESVLNITTQKVFKNYIEDIKNKKVKTILLNGVEFKVTKIKKDLIFNLGYSHKKELKIPKKICCYVEKNGKKIKIKSFDRTTLGDFCNKILKLKKYNVYKNKGIKFENEIKEIKERKKR